MGIDGTALLEALPDAAVVLRPDGGVCAANQAALAWLGEVRGLDAAGWRRRLEEYLTGLPARIGEEGESVSLRLEGRGYPRRVYRCESRPLLAADGTPGGRLELLSNITEPVRAEEERARREANHARELEALQARLEQVERFKMDLTANVTHDLRTPLASIKASVSGLLAGDVTYDPAVLRDTLTVIEEETDRLQRRVQNLLSMSRMESGDATMSRDWVDLADVAGSVLETLQSIRGGRDVKINFPADLPLVMGDYDQLQIALRNLVENAFLYSPPGSPVEISASTGLGSVHLRVRDFGAGLMPDEFERVFDKFYRGRCARRIPGTGLGLPICRGIAEAHGGRLWAEHAPGGGVAFALSLPLDEQPDLLDAGD